ncbi:hypothetical protein QR680_000766 [Steinernema hermaphroditum]|uniref:Uncharacterized protein n=1 Tax=Steinernema hermaphroditum TaxID=289476 RepID=A0AA39LEN8_9BILA|nr:hypothetical protein QR680_000766 [Steinernema hermaphroditum]
MYGRRPCTELHLKLKRSGPWLHTMASVSKALQHIPFSVTTGMGTRNYAERIPYGENCPRCLEQRRPADPI